MMNRTDDLTGMWADMDAFLALEEALCDCEGTCVCLMEGLDVGAGP